MAQPAADAVAELAAMKARGDIDQYEFDKARQILEREHGAKPRPVLQATAKPARTGHRNLRWSILAGFFGVLILMKIFGAGDTTRVGPGANASDGDRAAGFHCLSSWDGSSRALVDSVKAKLRDPGSFEHIETRITPRDASGNHRVIMEYRAKNGFGGMNVDTASGVLDGSDCRLRG